MDSDVDFYDLFWHDAIIHSIVLDKMDDDSCDTQVRLIVEWTWSDYEVEHPDEAVDDCETSFNAVVFYGLLGVDIRLSCEIRCVDSIYDVEREEITRGSERFYRYSFHTASTDSLISIIAKGFYLEDVT